MTTLNPAISPVYPDDYPRVVEVWEASIRATHDFVAPEDIDIFRPMVLEALPHLGLFCLRDSEAQVVGFIALWQDRVQMLFIHPDWRGQGVGRALLTHAVTVKGANALDVNEQNPQAVGFYQHMGFEVASRSPLDSAGKPYPILHLRLRDTSS